MKTYIYKFHDDRDRFWKCYYEEISTPLAPFFSRFTGNYLPGEDGEYELTDVEVELRSLSGKKKRVINLTKTEAMKYIDERLYDIELEEY